MSEAWGTRAAALAEVARAMAASAPPSRGLPFFGLDHASGTPLALVDDLATRGIFRKYEHVLVLGGGLGASARYLAARLGCSATASAGSCDEALAAGSLTARAGLEWLVSHVPASSTQLPFATAAFTHVWVIESLPQLGPGVDVLAEAARVLRPGGHLGVQDLTLAAGDDPLAVEGYVVADVREREIAAAGFVEVVRRDVPDDPTTDAGAERAWERIATRLGAHDAFVRRRRALRKARESGRLRIVQLTARRP